MAVVELADDLPADLPIAKVDRTALKRGDAVTLTGFGCTTGVHVTDDNVASALRSAKSSVVDVRAAVHDGSMSPPLMSPFLAGITH